MFYCGGGGGRQLELELFAGGFAARGRRGRITATGTFCPQTARGRRPC